MRLHHIVLSTVLALLTCGCTQSPPAQQAPVTSTVVGKPEDKSAVVGQFEELMPGEEVEKIFAREKRKGREDDRDALKHQEYENHLRAGIDKAAKANNVQRQVKLLIRLGEYRRDHRHAKQSLEPFNEAYLLADSLDHANPLYVSAPLAYGETFLRMGKMDDALKYFDDALSRMGPGVNAAGESRERIQLRIAWAYRMQDRLDDADKLLASAKASILEREGKRSATYRMALVEKSAIAQTREDDAAAAKINKAIAALPPMQPEGTHFARHFLRLASHVLHRKGVTLDEQDYLDEQADVFGDTYKAWLAKHPAQGEE